MLIASRSLGPRERPFLPVGGTRARFYVIRLNSSLDTRKYGQSRRVIRSIAENRRRKMAENSTEEEKVEGGGEGGDETVAKK